MGGDDGVAAGRHRSRRLRAGPGRRRGAAGRGPRLPPLRLARRLRGRPRRRPGLRRRRRGRRRVGPERGRHNGHRGQPGQSGRGRRPPGTLAPAGRRSVRAFLDEPDDGPGPVDRQSDHGSPAGDQATGAQGGAGLQRDPVPALRHRRRRRPPAGRHTGAGPAHHHRLGGHLRGAVLAGPPLAPGTRPRALGPAPRRRPAGGGPAPDAPGGHPLPARSDRAGLGHLRHPGHGHRPPALALPVRPAHDRRRHAERHDAPTA